MTAKGKTPADDPFADLSQFRLSQDFATELGVEKLLLRVPVRKPGRQEFVRTHPHPDYSLDTALIEVSEDREWFIARPDIRQGLLNELRPVRLTLTINRSRALFLWPLKLPDIDGKSNAWNESGIQAAELAKTSWVRVASNRSQGYYEVYRAAGDLGDPEWPDRPFAEYMRIAFANGHLIDNPDHPVVKRILGL